MTLKWRYNFEGESNQNEIVTKMTLKTLSEYTFRVKFKYRFFPTLKPRKLVSYKVRLLKLSSQSITMLFQCNIDMRHTILSWEVPKAGGSSTTHHYCSHIDADTTASCGGCYGCYRLCLELCFVGLRGVVGLSWFQ